jgi:hypothetical protein
MINLNEILAIADGLDDHDPETAVAATKLRALVAEHKALREALKDLYTECCEAGNDSDPDYEWPAVMARARKALVPK